MKILFIEIDTETEWAVSSLGPAYIAAFVRERGHETAFLRAPFDAGDELVVDQVREIEPDIVGLSCTTRQWRRGKSLIRNFAAVLNIPALVGGVHATFAADQVVSTPGVDFVCVGEGEQATLELLDALEGGRGPGAIDNIWCVGGDRPRLRPPFAPLDDLPFPARDMLDEPAGVSHVVTQRGCSYPCTHCASRAWSEFYARDGMVHRRRRSHKNVIDELLAIMQSRPLHWVTFVDDTFTLDHRWVREFCAEYRERVNVGFSVLARAESVSERLLGELAEAGCKMVTYGVESGSDRVRRDILRRAVSDQRIADVVRWTKAAGMMVIASYMIGIPGETRDDLEMTLGLIAELDCYDFNCFVFYPFPGTALYDLCRNRGFLPEGSEDLPANHRESVLRLPDLGRDEIADYYERIVELRKRTWARQHAAATSPEDKRELARNLAKVVRTI